MPQINAFAGDTEHKLTMRICKLKGYGYDVGTEHATAGWLEGSNERGWHFVELRNKSLSLDQVVGMLRKEGIEYLNSRFRYGRWDRRKLEFVFYSGACHPHYFEPAAVALIKALEEKKGEPDGDQSTGKSES